MGPCFRRDDAAVWRVRRFEFKQLYSQAHTSAFSPRNPREFCLDVASPGEQRAQGMPGAQCARSLACKMKKAHEHSHHGHTENTRHSPRNGFNGFLRALPGDRACLPPSPAEGFSANLTPASGRQDHTTSPSALSVLRLEAPKRPPHPAPNVRDDRANAPLEGRGIGPNLC
jgi:hypothetical protein